MYGKSIYGPSLKAKGKLLIDATDLLSEKTTQPILSFVAETDGTVVGHVAYSPVTIDNNENFQGYILAPLVVKPEYQKHRIGSMLIENDM